MMRSLMRYTTTIAGSAHWLAGLALVLGLAAVPDGAAAQVMDDHIYWMVMADELEAAPGLDGRPILLDASIWVGDDYDRLWINLEGAASTVEADGDLEAQALYSRLISPFFEVQAGLGIETVYGAASSRSRGLLVLGLQGLAPYWFEVRPQLLVSHRGDIALTLSASYEVLFTQRLILEPALDLKVALQEVPEFDVASGLNDMTLSGRLRYELVREVGPYIGVEWNRRFGGAADLARAAGADVGEVHFVAGIRVWY